MDAIITLTTDLGLTDAYVAAMKGVILGINPRVRLVDICHTIKPQNILQGAFVLSTAYQFFPKRTVHLVVVDPGVGTARRAIILRTPAYDFVAPDNGVLSYVMAESSPEPVPASQSVAIKPPLEAIAISNAKYWRSPVSPTFHGRDIFAPVAAHLSLGVPLKEFGPAITSLNILPLRRPDRTPDGQLTGRVLHIDNFGNLITNIKEADLPRGEHCVIETGGRQISRLSRTYGEGGGLLALIGSSGYLEIALKEGSADDLLHAEIGDEVRVTKLQGGQR